MKILDSPITSNKLKPCLWETFERAGSQWFVVYTKIRQEKSISQVFSEIKVKRFLPLIRKAGDHGRRKFTALVPLFPSYLLLRGELDDAYTADRTKRIARIIRTNDQEHLHDELRNLYLALTKNAILDPYLYLEEGIRVEVRSGPFQGIHGIIETRSKSDKLILQIETLGQATSQEIDGSLLEPLDR